MKQDFKDRIVVVTGAAVGIGKATAAAFGSAGARVYVIDVDSEAGMASAEAVTDAVFIHCDLTLEEDVAAAVDLIDRSSGRIDVLVNNAGGFPEALGLEETSIEEWHRILDANLTSVFLMTRPPCPCCVDPTPGASSTSGRWPVRLRVGRQHRHMSPRKPGSTASPVHSPPSWPARG